MAQPAQRNGTSSSQERETFHKFFECWLVEQNQHLQELILASNQQREQQQGSSRNGQEELDRRILHPLIERVIEHYEQYYKTKSTWAKKEILSMFNPSWRSSLEDAFLWIGGWRPSMAFHLLYSKSGLQLEARIEELIRGLRTGDLGDLSPSQMNRVDELHRETIRREKEITEKQAKQQEGIADTSIVELSHIMTEVIREERAVPAVDDGRVNDTLAPKEEKLVGVLQMADDLRLKTLRKVLEILSPTQGVHFLIAAAELHLRFHEWGTKRDAMLANGRNTGMAH